MTFEELANKYLSNKAANSQRYHLFYEDIFGRVRDEVTSFMEIGLALAKEYAKDGQINPHVPTSLRIWIDYFPKAEVVGFDIKDFSFLGIDRGTIYRGDQGSSADLARLVTDHPEGFDGIVDDGSHIAKHQQLTFEHLFPTVRPGGHYVIEDLHIEFDWDTKESGIRTLDLVKRWEAGEWFNPGMHPNRFAYLKDHIGSFQWGYLDRVVAFHKR